MRNWLNVWVPTLQKYSLFTKHYILQYGVVSKEGFASLLWILMLLCTRLPRPVNRLCHNCCLISQPVGVTKRVPSVPLFCVFSGLYNHLTGYRKISCSYLTGITGAELRIHLTTFLTHILLHQNFPLWKKNEQGLSTPRPGSINHWVRM